MRTILALFIASAACSSSHETEITLSLPPAPELSASAAAVALLYGYDNSGADVSATLIERYVRPITVDAATLDLALPADAHELIEPWFGPVSPENARFYFNVYVDVNGDRQVCRDDLIQDFAVTDFESFAVVPASLEIAMTKVASDGGCVDPYTE